MAARVVAVFVIAFLSVKLAGQSAMQTQITIQVVDPTGALIQGARIEIDPSPDVTQNVEKANSSGEVIVNLPVGSAHVLRVSSSGFRPSVISLGVEDHSARTVKVTLQVGAMGPAYSGPCCWFFELEPWNRLESVQLLDTIPLTPMVSFAPLPSRRIKGR